jgi:hypothetical protein
MKYCSVRRLAQQKATTLHTSLNSRQVWVVLVVISLVSSNLAHQCPEPHHFPLTGPAHPPRVHKACMHAYHLFHSHTVPLSIYIPSFPLTSPVHPAVCMHKGQCTPPSSMSSVPFTVTPCLPVGGTSYPLYVPRASPPTYLAVFTYTPGVHKALFPPCIAYATYII